MVLLLAAGMAASRHLAAQTGTVAQGAAAGGLLDRTPRTWVADACANELIALHHKGSYLRYRMHVVNEKGDQTREVIESTDGPVARVLMRDGKPLDQEQDEWERSRLNDMLASPSAYARHVRNSESEKRLADRLIPLMPDALLFRYVPGQPQTGVHPGRTEIVIDYSPNPEFVPPNTEAEVLTGLAGRVWIDARTHQLIRMEGTISRAVNFGWGVLAHIYPGGRLALNQTSVGESRWILSSFSMQLNVRALMLKSVKVDSNVEASDFQVIGPMSYQNAIHLLLMAPLPGR